MKRAGFIPGILGGLLIMAGRLHMIWFNAHMTEAQAMIAYWPVWAIGVLGIGITAHYISKA